jgi:hypothetical protein
MTDHQELEGNTQGQGEKRQRVKLLVFPLILFTNSTLSPLCKFNEKHSISITLCPQDDTDFAIKKMAINFDESVVKLINKRFFSLDRKHKSSIHCIR